MADSNVAITAGSGTTIDTFQVGSDHRQIVQVATDHGGYVGRCATFITPGRAGTAGQKIFALHNATGSSVVALVKKIVVDTYCTVVKAVTVPPPTVRLWKVTVLPSNGTVGTKVARDSSATASSASVTVWQDASSDRTSSVSALTATLPAGTVITEEFAGRLITAAGEMVMDRIELMAGEDEDILLRPLEGLVVFLDYTATTQNPTTDMWIVGCHWEEYVA